MILMATSRQILLLVVVFLSSPDSSSSPGGDETDLASSRCSSLDRGSFANMLMVTT